MFFFSRRRSSARKSKISSRQTRRPAGRSSYRPSLEALEDRLVLSTFLVINTNDSGAGSLRDAITRVNGDTTNTNPDVVNFHIPGPGPFTIQLTSPLPNITHPISINGESENAFLHQKVAPIALDGSGITGDSIAGLVLEQGAVSHSTIQGLAIKGFSGDGIDVSSAGSSLTFRDNTIATSGRNGINISSGGSNISFVNNRITGNYQDAIDISSGGSNITFNLNVVNGTTLQEGVDLSSGGSSLTFTKNSFTGAHAFDVIDLSSGGSNINITANIIAGDVRQGVDISGGATNLQFARNRITITADSSLTNQASLVLGGSTAGTSATINNNTFDTQFAGTGVSLESMNSVSSISFQDNNFRSNLVGVFIQGDGTTAGTIDLGGGSLGSTGGNDFRATGKTSGINVATTSSYAIGLFNVAPTFTVFAEHNLFSSGDGTRVIADLAHDTAAAGSGVIMVA
jgi:hypothetical protein